MNLMMGDSLCWLAKTHFNISATWQEDLGTYNCGKIFLNHMLFADGILLMLTGENITKYFILLIYTTVQKFGVT
jgi:hypothetical protein